MSTGSEEEEVLDIETIARKERNERRIEADKEVSLERSDPFPSHLLLLPRNPSDEKHYRDETSPHVLLNCSLLFPLSLYPYNMMSDSCQTRKETERTELENDEDK